MNIINKLQNFNYSFFGGSPLQNVFEFHNELLTGVNDYEFNNETLRIAVNLWVGNRAEAITQYGDISLWNVSKVTNMIQLFSQRSDFNENISGWDVRNVTNMTWMFDGASAFNQPLQEWNVGKVTSMEWMFYGASAFNQPIGKWNVENVTSMANMFYKASAFNQPLNEWNVSKVTNMFGMFDSAHSFNQTLDKWDTSNVTVMNRMFNDATSFNSDSRHWDISNVTNMEDMFHGATAFIDRFPNANNPRSIFFAPHRDETIKTAIAQWFNNKEEAIRQYGDISLWNVSKVTNMSQLFSQRSDFNENISGWDVRNVIDMEDMFYYASAFNQPLNEWNVSNVTNMSGMFGFANSFNQTLDKWDTSNVTSTANMFNDATSFNSDIRHWDISNVTTMEDMFDGATAFIERFPNANNDPRSIFISSEINTPTTQRNLMSQFDDTVDETCTLTSDKPTVGDYVKVSNIVTNYPSDIEEKQHIIYNKTIQGIYISENVIRILDENFKKTDQQIYPAPNGPVYKLISIHDYIKSKHIEYINLKLKIFQEDLIVQYPDDWSIADATTTDATTIDIGIDDKDKLPQFFDFIWFFLIQHGFKTGISVYNIPIFTLKFTDQIGTDYSGLFNTFLSTFVLSLTKKEPVTINYFNSSLDCLSFNKEFQLSKELSKKYTNRIKIFIEDLFLTSPNSLLDEDRDYHRVIYSYFTSSFLARVITLEPHHSIKEFYGSHLFIPDLKLDPYILISMKNYITNKKIIAENKYKDKDKQFSIFQDIIDYLSKNKSIDIVFDISKETKYRSIIKNEMNILFPSDIYTIDQLYKIYEKISEGSILRKSTSFEILQLHKIETEEEWDTKWDASEYSYKLHSALEDLDDNVSEKDFKLFKIDFKDKDIWIKFLLQYEFENLLDGSGINLTFFIHGFFSTYYTISEKYGEMTDTYVKLARGSLRMFKNIPDITELDLFLDFGKDLINSLSLDELNILFSGPQEINKNALKEAITINNGSTLENDYIIQQIHKGIDGSDDETLKLFLQSITGFKSLLGKNIRFSIHETSTWHEGLTIHTCFSNIEIDSRLFRDISTLQGELDDLNSKITKTEEDIKKIKTIEWSIENNIMKKIFNKDWLTGIISEGFLMVGGAYEIINSLSNFNF